MGSDNFCLRWNDFESNVSGSFRELREERDLFDVTLVTDTDKEFRAHKVILSACSSFFKGILRRIPSPSPLIYLRGIGAEELSAILDFMYNGEVNVAQEELNSFLSVAEDLRVKGLTQKPSSSSSGDAASAEQEDSSAHRKMGAKSKPVPSSPSSSSSKKFRRIAPKPDEDGVKDVLPVKAEPSVSGIPEAPGDFDETAGGDPSTAGSYDDTFGDEASYFDETGMMGLEDVPPDASQDNSKDQRAYNEEDVIKKVFDGGAYCTLCHRSYSGMTSAKRHFLIFHTRVFQKKKSCGHCGTVFKNVIYYKNHLRIKHGIYQRDL